MTSRSEDAEGLGRDRRVPLVVVGASMPRSGFTRVLEEVLPRLARTFEVRWIGVGCKRPEHVEAGVYRLPCNLHGGDVFGAFQARDVVRRTGARLVLLLNDLWMLRNYRATLEGLEGVRTLAYCPIDGRIVRHSLVDDLRWMDSLVAYTSFGLAELESALQRLGSQPGSDPRPRLEVIPHGIDATRFRPLSATDDATRRLDARRRIVPDQPDLWERIWVLNANRPTPRKRIDLTLRGFARFCRESESKAVLWLHHALADPTDWESIQERARALGITDRLLLSPCETGLDGSDADLNLLYNACEIGLNTAMGEGWGLVSFEHGATGAAQIVPAVGATGELWAGAAELLSPVRHYVPPHSLLELAEVSPVDVGDALRRLIGDPELLEARSRTAMLRARRRDWQWDAVADRWRRLLLSRLDGRVSGAVSGARAPRSGLENTA